MSQEKENNTIQVEVIVRLHTKNIESSYSNQKTIFETELHQTLDKTSADITYDELRQKVKDIYNESLLKTQTFISNNKRYLVNISVKEETEQL